ncbi:acyltransferase family protein [Pseudoclavibacter helvolus]|uniref:acyltransferase family protein n=1 Tax=Pseudoclavibacter helvolus TaxID=255205 RepID=UPI003C74BD4C
MSPSPLRDALSTRDNALNFVRLGLAVVVIFDHAWAVGGFSPEPTFEPAIWAVNGFFAISGYLIAGSRMRLSLGQYLTSRFLRIYPAYAVVLLATAFLLAPISTILTGEHWSAPSAGGYVLQNSGLYIFQLGIDDTLTQVPFPRAWNGSLWTLFYEFACYIVAGLVLSLAFVRRRPLLSSSLLLTALIGAQVLISPVADNVHPVIVNMLRLMSFFAAGMLLHFSSTRVSSRPRNVVIAIGLIAVLAAFGLAVLTWDVVNA